MKKQLPRTKDLEDLLFLLEAKVKPLTPTNNPSSSSSSSSSSKSESSLNSLNPASKSSSSKKGFLELGFLLKFGQRISAVTRREPPTAAAAGMKSEIIAPPHIFFLSLEKRLKLCYTQLKNKKK